jgi:hypothetical protein
MAGEATVVMVLLRSFRCHRSNGIGLAKAFLTRGKNL